MEAPRSELLTDTVTPVVHAEACKTCLRSGQGDPALRCAACPGLRRRQGDQVNTIELPRNLALEINVRDNTV